MKDSKRQTMLMVGVAMLIMSAIMIYVALSGPKVYDSTENDTPTSGINQVTQAKTDSELYTAKNEISFPVNLNTATVDELSAIDGIGEKRASDIIAYRQVIGRYKSVEEIKNIKGIGDSLYNQVAPYLTV